MVSIKNDEERREWLDAVVNLKKAEMELSDGENGRPIMQSEERVHIYKDVNLMASAAGAELCEERTESKEYPFMYSFLYKGVLFLGFFKERLERYERV